MSQSPSPYCNCLFYSVNALARQITKMAEEEWSYCSDIDGSLVNIA